MAKRSQPDLRWSLLAYQLLLTLYPLEFRREFGESMRQVFVDLARDAWNSAGFVGILQLWILIVFDLLRSLARLDGRGGGIMLFRSAVAAGILYLVALAGASAYGALRYGEFYQPPSFSRFNSSAPADEDALLTAYDAALAGEFGRYRTFAAGAGIALGILLGIAAALAGLWRRSLLLGAGALATGAIVTTGVLSLLPTIWFPLDRYPVGFIWMLRGMPLALGAWLCVTIAARVGSAHSRHA